MYTIAQLKDDLTGMSHTTTLDKVTNLQALLNRVAGDVLLRIDPRETIRKIALTNAIYDNVYDDSLPDDFKALIDIQPQIGRGVDFRNRPSRQFNFNKDLEDGHLTASVEWSNAVQMLRISKDISNTHYTVHEMDSLTANGAWGVGGDATNLTLDEVNFLSGLGGLNFDLDGSTTSGYIEVSDMNVVNLSDIEDVGSIFMYGYLPVGANVTSIELRWGSSSVAYWSQTVTSPFDTSSFRNGWNLLRFDWNGAAKTGSPDSSAIDYLRITVNYNGTADTDFIFDSITAQQGELNDLVYYSKYLFRDASGNWIERTTKDSDIINLSKPSYNIYLNECALALAHQKQGEDSGFDVDFLSGKLEDTYDLYTSRFPSERIELSYSYYNFDV